MITRIQCLDQGVRRDREVVRDVWVGRIVRMVSRWSVVRMCCNRWGAQWPGLIFEVTCLRSMAVVVTEASITGRFRKKRRAYKDQSSSTSLLLKLLKGPSSFMLAAYIVFELRSDQHNVIPPYIPRIRRCRRSPLPLVIVPSSFEMALPAFPLWPPHSPVPTIYCRCYPWKNFSDCYGKQLILFCQDVIDH